MGARIGSWALWTVAALAAAIAIVLAVLAIDVLRSPGQLADDDRRFNTEPTLEAGRLWDVGFLPRDASERLLELEDDVSYRRVAGLYLMVEPGVVAYEESPTLEAQRADAERELDRLAGEESDPRRLSRLLTLYGVMTLDGPAKSAPADSAERREMLETAVSAFRDAIDLDPSNVDAMTNLEAVMDKYGAVSLDGTNPSRS
jgi:hypothetical protein